MITVNCSKKRPENGQFFSKKLINFTFNLCTVSSELCRTLCHSLVWGNDFERRMFRSQWMWMWTGSRSDTMWREKRNGTETVKKGERVSEIGTWRDQRDSKRECVRYLKRGRDRKRKREGHMREEEQRWESERARAKKVFLYEGESVWE